MLKRAIIREELYSICESSTASLILNQMIYWTTRGSMLDKMLDEAVKRLEMHTYEQIETVDSIKSEGWIYKRAEDIGDEIMSDDSRTTIRRKVTILVNKGYLLERKNPKVKFDNTLQYKVNFKKIEKDLNKKGYSLKTVMAEQWPIAKELIELDNNDAQNELPKFIPEHTDVQNEHGKIQNERTIPESTLTENTRDNKKKGEIEKNKNVIGYPHPDSDTCIESFSEINEVDLKAAKDLWNKYLIFVKDEELDMLHKGQYPLKPHQLYRHVMEAAEHFGVDEGIKVVKRKLIDIDKRMTEMTPKNRPKHIGKTLTSWMKKEYTQPKVKGAAVVKEKRKRISLDGY